MKNIKFCISLLIITLLSGCSTWGEVGFEHEYLVSGYVYMPDSVTPLSGAVVRVNDYGLFKETIGYGETSFFYSTHADENGFFKIQIDKGAARKIDIDAYYYPKCDTAELEYHYKAYNTVINYTKKHCFENLTLYSHVLEDPKRPSYTIPSYPIIGDSVLVHINPTSILSGASYIMHISLIEDDRDTIFSMNYNGTSAEEMFYVPETADVMKKHRIYVRENNGSAYLKVTLREK